MKTVWAFREVGTELLLLAWFSISWGLDVIVSGLIPDESKTFVISPKRPDQLDLSSKLWREDIFKPKLWQ